MKTDPVTFSAVYNSNNIGFDAFKNQAGEYIYERKVTLTPDIAGKGSLDIKIVEKYISREGGIDYYERKIYSGRCEANPKQCWTIQGLYNREITGRYAENEISTLYKDMFLLNPQFREIIRCFLPRVVKVYSTIYLTGLQDMVQ